VIYILSAPIDSPQIRADRGAGRSRPKRHGDANGILLTAWR